MEWLKPYTDPLNNQNLCNSVTKSFLLMLPNTIPWNFQGWSFIRISKGRQSVFLSYSPTHLFEFFWNSPISPLCLNFPRVKVTNLKVIGIFFKKVCPWPPSLTPCLDFYWNGQFQKRNRGFEDMMLCDEVSGIKKWQVEFPEVV